MSLREIVIVGSGQAGFQVAASLRQDGYDGRILMFGDELSMPYQRPPLSKTFLKEGNVERLLFRNADFYPTSDIDLRLGSRVTSISTEAGTVTTENGEEHRFDHLVLATGTRNRRLPLAGLDAPNVFAMRTLEDALAIRERMDQLNSFAVIGGGFIGLEFAAAAKQLGKDSVVIEAQDRLMARAVSKPISDYFLEAHRNSGVDVLLGQMLASVELADDGTAQAVIPSNGERLECDAILIAAGVVPNTGLAEAAGLRIDNGIVVDGTMLTSAPNVSALGDCVSFQWGGRQIRLESVQNAVDQARCIAKRLTGSPEYYDKLPWFWSDQGYDKLQIAGLVDVADEIVARPGETPNKLSVFGFQDGILCAVETVNVPGDHMAARKLLSSDRRISRAELEASGYRLKELMQAG